MSIGQDIFMRFPFCFPLQNDDPFWIPLGVLASGQLIAVDCGVIRESTTLSLVSGNIILNVGHLKCFPRVSFYSNVV